MKFDRPKRKRRYTSAREAARKNRLMVDGRRRFVRPKRKHSDSAALVSGPPGKASDYIDTTDDLQPGDKVVLCCRVSRCAQDHNGNLADQEQNLRQLANKCNLRVIEVIPHVGSGWELGWLYDAAKKAQNSLIT